MAKPRFEDPKSVLCPYCALEAELVTGAVVYPHRPDLASLRFWQCSPCEAYVGCHKGTKAPLGRLADATLRKAKQRAHAAFDPLWKNGGRSRDEAYAWLSKELNIPPEECHIGMFDVHQCKRVEDVCDAEHLGVLLGNAT